MDPKQQASKVLMVFAWIFSLQYKCAALTCPMQCDFSRDLCGWTATNGAVGSTFQWARDTQGYARLDTSNRIGVSSDLQSPWLDSQPGLTCQLTFRYYLGGSEQSGCGLSVIQKRVNSGDTTLTSIRQAVGNTLSFSNHPPVQFDCQSGSQYQIIFRGSVITGSGNNCGLYPQIAVDDISCTATTTTTTTTTKPTTTTTTPTPRKTTTKTTPTPILPDDTTQLTTTVPGPEETSICVECTTDETASSLSAGVGPGATAGIALAGVAVIVVVVVSVVIVVVKRRGSGAGKQGGPEQHVYVNTEFQEDSVTTTDHHNRDHHEDSHHGNENDRSAPAYQNVDAIHAQTNQNASNNIYEPLANEDVGLSNPYNVLTNESAPNTYEAFSSRADSHVYKTLTNQKRDADGYEWPVARAKP